MKYDVEQKEELRRLQARVDAKLEQVRDMVGPELAAVAPEELQPLVAQRLGRNPAERVAMQIKAAVAHAELTNLLGQMNRHLEGIADEMRHTSRYSNAAAAYGKNITR